MIVCWDGCLKLRNKRIVLYCIVLYCIVHSKIFLGNIIVYEFIFENSKFISMTVHI